MNVRHPCDDIAKDVDNHSWSAGISKLGILAISKPLRVKNHNPTKSVVREIEASTKRDLGD